MHIEKANSGDIPKLLDLYRQFTENTCSCERAAMVLRHIQSNPCYHLLVARTQEGTIIGTAMGIICLNLTNDCDPFMIVENVAVCQEGRDADALKLLMLRLEEVAQANQCSYIVMVTDGEGLESGDLSNQMDYKFRETKSLKKILRFQ